jgi:hypothetical protein
LAWNQITPHNKFAKLFVVLLDNPWLFNRDLWEMEMGWRLTGAITLGTVTSLKAPGIRPPPEK